MNQDNSAQVYGYIEETGEIVEYDGVAKTMNYYPSSWKFLGEGYICGYNTEGKLWSLEEKTLFLQASIKEGF